MVEQAHLRVADSGGQMTITAGGTLTFWNSDEFGEIVKEAALSRDALVVDLSSAEFIDSKVVQDLGRAGAALLSRGKRLRVIVDKLRYPYRVLQISTYDTIMDIQEAGVRA